MGGLSIPTGTGWCLPLNHVISVLASISLQMRSSLVFVVKQVCSSWRVPPCGSSPVKTRWYCPPSCCPDPLLLLEQRFGRTNAGEICFASEISGLWVMLRLCRCQQHRLPLWTENETPRSQPSAWGEGGQNMHPFEERLSPTPALFLELSASLTWPSRMAGPPRRLSMDPWARTTLGALTASVWADWQLMRSDVYLEKGLKDCAQRQIASIFWSMS